MQGQQSSQPQGPFENTKTGMNLFALLCQSMAVSVEVFLHKGFGERYIGLQAGLVIPLVFVFSMFFPDQDPTPLFGFLVAFLAMCAVTRVGTLVRRWKGNCRVHSRYNGWPRLARFFPRCQETTVKRYEALPVFLIGSFLLPVSLPLGAYLMVAALALATSFNLIEARDRVRALDMNDAVIEQTQIAERFREMNGDRR